VCFIVLGVAVVGLGWDGVLSRLDGVLLVLAFVAVFAFALARSRVAQEEVRNVLSEYATTRGGLGLNIARFVIAAVVLFYGAKWIVQSAPQVGATLGMGPMLTGLVPVAIGTALPEIAAAVMAARRAQGDVVVGLRAFRSAGGDRVRGGALPDAARRPAHRQGRGRDPRARVRGVAGVRAGVRVALTGNAPPRAGR
jgi:hypothetical protein